MPMTFGQVARQVSELLAGMATEAFDCKVTEAVDMLASVLRERKPVLVFGNGGSASDAQHIAGELVGRFLRDRRPFNVMALPSNTSLLTAWSNDYDYETVFARQIEAHGFPGGVAWGISTSGNSPSVLRALETARAVGMRTLGLAGHGGGKMAPLCDVLLDVPSRMTPRVQELHAVLYHYICECVETALADDL